MLWGFDLLCTKGSTLYTSTVQCTCRMHHALLSSMHAVAMFTHLAKPSVHCILNCNLDCNLLLPVHWRNVHCQ